MKNKAQNSPDSQLNVDKNILDAFEGKLPRHVAIIMDGNGRWAQQRGWPRLKGHYEGANAVRRVVESCRYLGVEVLTLYAFSTQNWGRPEDEVSGLMSLFDLYLKKERERLLRNEIALKVIGDRSKLSEHLQESIRNLEQESASGQKMTLQVAVSYGGREEILRAVHQVAQDVREGKLSLEQIDEQSFSNYLYTENIPDPDLVIRTSGECRISNFLLWQIAYSELLITDTLWPDFAEAHLLDAFRDYNQRQRRYGKTGEQIEGKK